MAKEVINSWKIEKFPVSADVARAEFDRIYDKCGELTKENLVNESRDANAALHACFEWNDAVAAEKYRIEQAGDMIRCLVTVEKPDDAKAPIVVRAYVKTTENFEPIKVALQSEEKYAVLIQDALDDIQHFRNKHRMLLEMKSAMATLDSLEATLKGA